MGLSIIQRILSLFRTSFGKSTNKKENEKNTWRKRDNPQQREPTNKKKIIGDDEGEYVDYEEVK